MMKKSGKILLIMMLALALCCFVAACSNDAAPQDDENQSDIVQNDNTDEQQTIPASQAIDEMTDIENIKEINIYLHGVKNTIPIDDNISVLLVESLADTLLAANQDNSLLAADTVDSVDELTSVYTCLEVVYNDQVNLPITQDNENFIADEVIYAIYANSDAANVVAINGSIFGSINESNLSGIIEEYVLTNLQTTDFNGEQVTVGSITTTYLKDQSDDIEETLLNQLLYNAIAFYQNCYNKNYEAIAPICTDDLNAAIANNSGSSTGNGVDIIFNMSQYFTYTDPVSLQGVYDGHVGDNILYINVDNMSTLSIVCLDTDGTPYIDACHLMSA